MDVLVAPKAHTSTIRLKDVRKIPMKILPFDPNSAAGATGLDDSRLGLHATAINISELGAREHGIVLLGIADDTGIRNVKGKPGAAEGPRASREKMYRFTTGAPSFPLYDAGDILPENTIEETHASATRAVRAIAAAGHFPIVIGGGHDLGFPHALGVLEHTRARTRFLNIDAHLDVRPTTGGITSGSPWYLLREHALFQSTRSAIHEFGIQPHCNAHSLVRYAEKHGFGLHWLENLRAKNKPADLAFAKLLGPPKGKERLLVSLDIDSVEFAAAPGCSAPQTLGFSPREVIRTSFLAGAHPRCDSFGVFELSPPLDPDGRTALLVAHCINAAMAGFATRRKVKRR
jgi:formiminoglutamase